jgi:hypothetical protein
VSSNDGGQKSFAITPKPKRVPENRFTFCLDHLVNGFADDAIRVLKTNSKTETTANEPTASPFLSLVASHATDQSVEIIRKLILTAFRIISLNPDFKNSRATVGADAGGQEILRDLTFDPFNQNEVAEINKSLVPLGFCIVFEDFSFDTSQRDVGRYCNDPISVASKFPSKRASIVKSQRYLIPKPTSGIFYRPRTDHAVSVYTKSDPGAAEPWRILDRKWMPFENDSPILSVGVGRAMFATRRTGLIFDEGMLKNVCVSKGSEVAGFVTIPLDIVYGVIALPGQTIRGTINRFETRRQLIAAQEQLVEAQEAYIDYLSTPSNVGDPGLTGAGQTLTLGKIPTVPTAKVNLTDYGNRINGDTADLESDTVLANICQKLSEDGPLYIKEERF